MKNKKKNRKDFKSDLEFNFYIDAVKRLRKSNKVLEYETVPIEYTYTITYERTYTPDFPLRFPDGHIRYVETKGYFRPEDRSKMLRVKKCNPKLDIRLVFPIDNKLGRKYKMRYSDWCKRYKFKYHIGTTIPQKWLTRRG